MKEKIDKLIKEFVEQNGRRPKHLVMDNVTHFELALELKSKDLDEDEDLFIGLSIYDGILISVVPDPLKYSGFELA